jgi:hypothetical protein
MANENVSEPGEQVVKQVRLSRITRFGRAEKILVAKPKQANNGGG